MKSILIKDFAMLWRVSRLPLLTFVCFLVAVAVTGQLLWCSVGIGVLAVMPHVLLEIDERGGWLRFLFSAPVRRRDYVAEKYLMSLVLLGGGFAMALLVQGVRSLFVPTAGTPLGIAVGVCALPGMLAPAVGLPFSLRFGAVKGRQLSSILVTVLCMACGSFTGTYYNSPGAWSAALEQHRLLFALGGLVIGGGALLLSYCLSCRVMAKKEY